MFTMTNPAAATTDDYQTSSYNTHELMMPPPIHSNTIDGRSSYSQMTSFPTPMTTQNNEMYSVRDLNNLESVIDNRIKSYRKV